MPPFEFFGHAWMEGVDEKGRVFCYGAYPRGMKYIPDSVINLEFREFRVVQV